LVGVIKKVYAATENARKENFKLRKC
jgi:hypothetical protein